MAEILHQLIGSLSHYFGFIHPRWCRISAINSISNPKCHNQDAQKGWNDMEWSPGPRLPLFDGRQDSRNVTAQHLNTFWKTKIHVDVDLKWSQNGSISKFTLIFRIKYVICLFFLEFFCCYLFFSVECPNVDAFCVDSQKSFMDSPVWSSSICLTESRPTTWDVWNGYLEDHTS